MTRQGEVMKSVLITGGEGYLGRHIRLAIESAGIRAVSLDRSAPAKDRPSASSFVGCISHTQLIEQIIEDFDVSGVIHVAGSKSTANSLSKPQEYYTNNVHGSFELFRAALRAGVKRIVFTSSAAVYGPFDVPAREHDKARPRTPYGRSKLLAEQLLASMCTHANATYAILRCFNIAGQNALFSSHYRRASDLFSVTASAFEASPNRIDVHGTDYPTHDGTCVRDFVHVDDVSEAHVLALAYLWEGGRSCLVNCGTGYGASVLDVIAAFETATGRTLCRRPTARRPGDVPLSIADTSLMAARLGWSPSRSDLLSLVHSTIAVGTQER
ncbi:UDP-glucose 4-epimerase GalE [Vitreimonas sp.]|uniref:UDP-glucose 4-epimerase GalE n=1 Tax=Vitreimonas sp. TaxID=3069702 RepID=UPI0039C9A973